MSREATVVRNYLDWLLSIPWAKRSKIKKDLKLAQEVLDNDHFGLDKVKERIVEYLAVQQRANKLTGPILCLVGPPGVGKTSLGKSIARATGRDFVRVSLGGVHDEAEIRGHRRTYIGSMPGKIIQSMRKAKSSNPLFLLDEVDKMGTTSAATRPRRCSKFLIPSRITPSTITISRSTTISPTSCSSPRRTRSTSRRR
jgi:ATP-dependent Lon protease